MEHVPKKPPNWFVAVITLWLAMINVVRRHATQVASFLLLVAICAAVVAIAGNPIAKLFGVPPGALFMLILLFVTAAVVFRRRRKSENLLMSAINPVHRNQMSANEAKHNLAHTMHLFWNLARPLVGFLGALLKNLYAGMARFAGTNLTLNNTCIATGAGPGYSYNLGTWTRFDDISIHRWTPGLRTFVALVSWMRWKLTYPAFTQLRC